jgi:polysaccharide biosynthesis protein PslA
LKAATKTFLIVLDESAMLDTTTTGSLAVAADGKFVKKYGSQQPRTWRPGGRPNASLIRWTYGAVNRIVMAIDAAALLAATFVYWASEPDHRPLTWLQAGAIAVITLIGFQIVMRWMRSYRVERYGQMLQSLTDVCVATVLAGIPAMIVVIAFLPNAAVPWLAGWMIASIAGLVICRQLDRLLLYIVRKRALLRTRVVVVGAGPEADKVVASLSNLAFANDYQLLGVVDPGLTTFRPTGEATEATTSFDLTEYAQNYAVDMVVIALPWERSREIFALTRRLQWIAADIVTPFVTAGFNPQVVSSVAFIDKPILRLMHRPFKGTQGLFKVVEDYVIAVIALIFTSPLMLAAMIALRIEGSAPIFFRQPRVGFNSKPFTMYKFRTMSVDLGDDGSLGTQRNNHRITRVGKFLRRTSIDELPQLINVLRGEMSIVGPRPHVSKMRVGKGVYSDVVQQYAARHRIKPGITGWAQINGMRGGINSLEKASRGADLDLYYIANWSPRLDLEIMARTIVAGLVGHNVF